MNMVFIESVTKKTIILRNQMQQHNTMYMDLLLFDSPKSKSTAALLAPILVQRDVTVYSHFYHQGFILHWSLII